MYLPTYPPTETYTRAKRVYRPSLFNKILQKKIFLPTSLLPSSFPGRFYGLTENEKHFFQTAIRRECNKKSLGSNSNCPIAERLSAKVSDPKSDSCTDDFFDMFACVLLLLLAKVAVVVKEVVISAIAVALALEVVVVAVAVIVVVCNHYFHSTRLRSIKKCLS